MSRTFYVTIYIHALRKNIAEKKYYKLFGTKEKLFHLLQSLVQGYLKLANLLEDVLSVCRECVLTAYALMPSSDLMIRIENFAIKSGKLDNSPSNDIIIEESTTRKPSRKSKKPDKFKKEYTADEKFYYVKSLFEKGEDCNTVIHTELSKLQPDPLSKTMIQHLIDVIREPRFGTLSWNNPWPDIKHICDQYLDNLDIVINRNMLQHSDLKFLNINIAEYNKYVEMNMKSLTNNKGYFSSDISSEDEESSESTSSGEVVSYSIRSSKNISPKNPKVGDRRKRIQITKESKTNISVTQSQPMSGIKTRTNILTQNNIVKESIDSINSSSLNDKTKKSNVKNKDNCDGSSLEENENVTDDKYFLEHDANCPIKAILEKNDNINPSKCMRRNKRIIKKKQHEDYIYSPSKSSVDNISRENEKLHSVNNVIEIAKSSVDTISEKNENVDQNLIDNDNGPISEEVDHLKIVNNLKKNTKPCQSVIREKRIIKRNQHEDYVYSSSKPSVDTISQQSEKVNFVENVIETAKSSADINSENHENVKSDKNLKTIEENDNVTTVKDLKKNSQPSQKITRTKRIVKKKLHDDYVYLSSKHSIDSIVNVKNNTTTTDNNIKKNNKLREKMARVLRVTKRSVNKKYYSSTKWSNSILKRNKKIKIDKNSKKNAKIFVDSVLNKDKNLNSDEHLIDNLNQSDSTILKINTNADSIKNSKINAKPQQKVTKPKRIVKKRQHENCDYLSSKLSVITISKNNENLYSTKTMVESAKKKCSIGSIPKKNKNVKTCQKNDILQQGVLRSKRVIKKKQPNDNDYSLSHQSVGSNDTIIAGKNLKGNTKSIDSLIEENKIVKPRKNIKDNAVLQQKISRSKRVVKKKQHNDYDYSFTHRSGSSNVNVDKNLKDKSKLSIDSDTTLEEHNNAKAVKNSKNNVILKKKAARAIRSVTKVQPKECENSLISKKIRKSNKTNISLNSEASKDSNICSTSISKPYTSQSSNTCMDNESSVPLDNEEHLNMLRQRLPQLSSLDFIVPANTDHIVNVVQIQTTSNPLTNVSQTQTEHVSNHSNNEIEKKTNDNQTNTHSLDNFVSLYQSTNSLNNSMNSIQNSGIHQGECSFTGSVSVSNQRLATDSITNLHNISHRETTKPIGSNDVLLDQHSINLDHHCWNDINLQNSGNRLQSTIENAVHLSSNVIVRTSDVINSSVVSHTGHITNTSKKPYCVKNRDRFIDLTLPASISSVSTNSNNCSTNVMNSNKSKLHQSSPVQTSVGLQVNFNNSQTECIQNEISLNNQSTQICTNVSEISTLNNMSVLNDQNIMNSINSRVSTSSIANTSFTKENQILDNLKSSMSGVNPVSNIQTQTCIGGLQTSNEVSNPSASVISSLMIASTQSQVIKTNVHNSLYTTSQNQRMPHTDLSHSSPQTNSSDEQNKIDQLKLVSQTFITTSEALKFVTSTTESQNFSQSNEKTKASISSCSNTTEGLSNVSQENDLISKPNRGRSSMRTYESKTRALKQANMSDMFIFEKGTLYAVQDDVNQIEPTKSVISPKSNIIHEKLQNKLTTKVSLEKPKLSPNASPNITITGSMLPRFQQVFGKTKFQTSTIINDTSLCSTSVISNPSNTGPIVNRTNLSMSRVYSSSKGVQTNNEIDQIISSSINCITPKIVDNKLQQNMTMTKSINPAIENYKNNVIMTCKTGSSAKNIPQVSVLSTHQTLTSNMDDTNNIIKKEVCGTSASKVPTFATSCNNLIASPNSSNIINSIPIQSDSNSNNNIDKIVHATTNRHLKVPPPIVQTILRRHPNWQQNCFRQGKQSTEVMASSTFERLISSNMSNVTKTTIECSNNKVLVSTIKPNVTELNVSSSMMEQVREFESVLEEVRKTSLMNEMSTASILPQINHEIIQIHSPTENVDLLSTNSNQTLFPLDKKLNANNERDQCSFSFLNHQTLSNVNDITSEEKESVTAPSTTISIRSVTPVPAITSPTNNTSVNSVDGSPQCPNKQIANKPKPVIKTPANSPSISTVKVPVLQQKPLPKLQEDEQTTQRIYAILDKYAEQLRNSPELKNKPAPRRRTNPPTNPSINTKRKKSNQLNLKSCSQQTSCSSSGMEMSPTSDMQALDSEDSSNAVSHFSHIINSPSGNSDEQNTATVILENPLIENTLINVHDVIKKINVEAEIKSQVSQSTQIVVSGTSGSFLSMPESSAANVRLVVAAGKNQKMYRLHCPVTGPGPVLFQQITTNDTYLNDVNISSNILGQNISESTILSALTSCDLQVPNIGSVNEISLNTSTNPTIIEHKTNKHDIILESMEKAQVLDNNEKQLPLYPILKKSQGSQSTFSVIHHLPKYESDDTIESLSIGQNVISVDTQNNSCDNKEDGLNIKQKMIPGLNNEQVIFLQEKLSKTLKEEAPFFIPPGSSESNDINFEDMEFSTFHSQEDEQNNEIITDINEKFNQQNISEIKIETTNTNDISVNYFSDNNRVITNEPNNLHTVICEDGTVIKQEESFSSTNESISNTLDFPNTLEGDEETKLNNVAAEILSTVNQTSNTCE